LRLWTIITAGIDGHGIAARSCPVIPAALATTLRGAAPALGT
jgi:hypothetical protein